MLTTRAVVPRCPHICSVWLRIPMTPAPWTRHPSPPAAWVIFAGTARRPREAQLPAHQRRNVDSPVERPQPGPGVRVQELGLGELGAPPGMWLCSPPGPPNPRTLGFVRRLLLINSLHSQPPAPQTMGADGTCALRTTAPPPWGQPSSRAHESHFPGQKTPATQHIRGVRAPCQHAGQGGNTRHSACLRGRPCVPPVIAQFQSLWTVLFLVQLIAKT